jgi:hypothetical protein
LSKLSQVKLQKYFLKTIHEQRTASVVCPIIKRFEDRKMPKPAQQQPPSKPATSGRDAVWKELTIIREVATGRFSINKDHRSGSDPRPPSKATTRKK